MRMLVGLALFAACGSGTDAVSGQLPGGNFQAADTISAAITMPDGNGGTLGNALIVIASTSSLCSDAGASIARKNQRFIDIELRDVNGASQTTPTAAGTYTIYPNTGSEPPKSATFTTGGLDSTCQPNDTLDASGESGTVQLTSVSGNTFGGSFDVVLNTGDHITGSFSPTPCPALATAVTSNQLPTCR